MCFDGNNQQNTVNLLMDLLFNCWHRSMESFKTFFFFFRWSFDDKIAETEFLVLRTDGERNRISQSPLNPLRIDDGNRVFFFFFADQLKVKREAKNLHTQIK